MAGVAAALTGSLQYRCTSQNAAAAPAAIFLGRPYRISARRGLVAAATVKHKSVYEADSVDYFMDDPNAVLEKSTLTAGDAEACPARRIAMFIEPSPWLCSHGHRTRFLATIRELVAAGDTVLVFTTGATASCPGVNPTSYCGARVITLAAFTLPWRHDSPVALALEPAVSSELRVFAPSVIHATSPGLMMHAAARHAVALHVPLVLSYHVDVCAIARERLPPLVASLALWVIAAWLRGIHAAAAVTLVPSSSVAADLTRCGIVAAAAVLVWQRGVDTSTYAPTKRSHAMRRRLLGLDPTPVDNDAAVAAESVLRPHVAAVGIVRPLARGLGITPAPPAWPPGFTCDASLAPPDPTAHVLLYAGRLAHEKSIDELIPLLDANPRSRLAIVGDGPARAYLARRFAGTRTTFLGALDGESMARAYASCDVFICPSRVESLGAAVLEAMASGAAIVAARAGGVSDAVSRDGVHGFLYDTPAGAAWQVRVLLSSAELRATVGAAAREEVTRYDWASSAKTLREGAYAAAVRRHDAGERGGQPAPVPVANKTNLPELAAGLLSC